MGIDISLLVQQYGLTTVLVGWFFYTKIWPWFQKKVFPQWVKEREGELLDRRKHSVEIEKQAHEYRVALLEEIKALREDSRSDKTLLYSAFMRDIEANTKLQGTLETINAQMRELTAEVMQLKEDVSKLYISAGINRNLIKGD